MDIAHLHVSTLRVENYRNIKNAILTLNPYINCFLGANGSGKTNLLDTIHYLCLTKSMLTYSDNALIKFEENYFRMECLAQAGKNEHAFYKIEAAYSNEQGKIFKVNQMEYDKISLHIGKFPLVVITPEDNSLITEGSEYRRRFFDTILCQMDANYLELLMKYNYVLKQRNAQLKKIPLDMGLLQIYDKHLIEYGQKIAKQRADFCIEFQSAFYYKYQYIASEAEKTAIKYQSELLKPDFEERFAMALSKDIAYERTTLGTHTDDYEFTIQGKSVKKTASQGQKKSFAIGLKLAQFDILKAHTQLVPLLLLDDIFDKLDDLRMQKLMKLVSSNAFGQVFVTDARPERSRILFATMGNKVTYFDFESVHPHESSVKQSNTTPE